MPRREYRASFTCAEPGCRDTQFFAVSTRRDEAEVYQQQKRRPYRCSRHADPDKNLRPGNERTSHVVVATRLPSGGLYWVPEGAATGSGYTFGPGFNAHASDFPEGTRLVITAQIELPHEAEAEAVDKCNACPAPATCSEFGRCTLESGDSSPLAAKEGSQ